LREAPAFASGLCHHHLANRAARSKRPPGVATMRFVSGPDFKQLAEKHSLAETHSLAEKHSPVKGHGFQPCHNSSKMNRASAPAGLPSPSRTVPGQTHKRPAAVPTELPSGITAMRFVSGPDFQSGRINSGAQRLPWFGRCLPPKLSRILQNFQMWKTCQEARSKSKVITSHSTPLTPLYPQSILAVLFLQYDILNL